LQTEVKQLHELARDIRVAITYLNLVDQKLNEVHLRLAALDRHVIPVLSSPKFQEMFNLQSLLQKDIYIYLTQL